MQEVPFAAPWHQYAHSVVAAGRTEANIQERLRPIVLKIRQLKKEPDTEAQVAALERKAEPLRAQLRALPVRVGRYALLACERHLRDLYKKSHWQVVGPTFYQLHLLFDKHYEEQAELVDTIAERIQILGGVAVAMAHDVAELSSIPRVPAHG